MMCKNIFQSIGLVYAVDKKKDEERKKRLKEGPIWGRLMDFWC